jgi:hypothetical protein
MCISWMRAVVVDGTTRLISASDTALAAGSAGKGHGLDAETLAGFESR